MKIPPKRIYGTYLVLVKRRWRKAVYYGTVRHDGASNFLVPGNGMCWVAPRNVKGTRSKSL